MSSVFDDSDSGSGVKTKAGGSRMEAGEDDVEMSDVSSYFGDEEHGGAEGGQGQVHQVLRTGKMQVVCDYGNGQGNGNGDRDGDVEMDEGTPTMTARPVDVRFEFGFGRGWAPWKEGAGTGEEVL